MITQNETYCLYYQAKIVRKKIWFVTGILRYEDHWCFDRTLDAHANILEFFVPRAFQERFEARMDYFVKEGLVEYVEPLPNRLTTENTL